MAQVRAAPEKTDYQRKPENKVPEETRGKQTTRGNSQLLHF